VQAGDAPKTWQEALDPKWTDAVNVKVSNSGLQHVAWFELRQTLGPDYWKKFAELKPRAFDSYVQQYDRLVNQQDKLIHTAQYSGYLEWKAKGAPVAFVTPPGGLPATAESWASSATRRTPMPRASTWIGFVAGRAEGQWRGSLRPFSARRCAGAAGRPADHPVQIADAGGLAGLSRQPREFQREWDRITGLR